MFISGGPGHFCLDVWLQNFLPKMSAERRSPRAACLLHNTRGILRCRSSEAVSRPFFRNATCRSSAQCVSAVSHAIWRTMHKLFQAAAAALGGRTFAICELEREAVTAVAEDGYTGGCAPASRRASQRARVLLHRLNPVLIDMDELWIWTTTAATVDAATAQNCHLSCGRWSMPTGGWWTRPWRAVPGSLHRPSAPLTCTPTVSTYRTSSTNIAGAGTAVGRKRRPTDDCR